MAPMVLPGQASDEESHYGSRVSPSGQYLGGTIGNAAVRWHDGDVVVIADPGDTALFYAVTGINSSGAMVGSRDADNPHGWRYDGSLTALESPDDAPVAVNGISESGVAVGNTYRDDAGSRHVDLPVTWEAGDTEPTILTTLPDGTGAATAITEDGAVLGWQLPAGGDSSHRQAWIWDPDGDDRALPTLSINDDAVYALPLDTAGDWALSYGLADGDGNRGSFRWKLSDPEQAEMLDPQLSPLAIDARGRVYGSDGHGLAAYQALDGELVTVPPWRDDRPGGQINDSSHDGSVLIGESGTGTAGDTDSVEAMAVCWPLS
jgi:hypothetical protein